MPMTIRERLMTTLQRGAADRIPETIYRYTMELLRTGAPGGRLVIGCTEDYPASSPRRSTPSAAPWPTMRAMPGSSHAPGP